MKTFTFEIQGASPGPGVIVVQAENIGKARRRARARIKQENTEEYDGRDALWLAGWLKDIESTPSILYFDSGER